MTDPDAPKPSREWTPSCIGTVRAGMEHVRWRIMTNPTRTWFNIECKDDADWEPGLSGTRDWLKLTEEEVARAYIDKRVPL